MIAKILLSALAAVAVLAKDDDACTQQTFTINSNADLSKLSSCTTLKGNVVVGNQTDSDLDFANIQKIDGDLTISDNPTIKSLKGSSLSSITGTMLLTKLTGLNSIDFGKLKSVKNIQLISCTALVDMGDTSIKQAENVQISDTHLDNLNAFAMESAKTVQVDNNKLLVGFTSKLHNVTVLMTLNSNGIKFALSFPLATFINEMRISNVSNFEAPALTSVNTSMYFDSNYFTTVQFPNLTSVGKDISFINNGKVENITFGTLQHCTGSVTVVNNTNMEKVVGYSKLEDIGGAVAFGGNFTEVAFPTLKRVGGTFNIQSTGDIQKSCDELAKLAPPSQGGNGSIGGKYTCTSNNAEANSNTSSGSSSSGGSGKGSGKDNAATGYHANMVYILGASMLGLALQALL